MDVIGKYQLVRLIGEGGMGRVYEAIDPIIGRRVAIKTISLNTVIDAETRSRFFREAQAAGQLSHPNLITIHDIGDAEGTPYIVMEFLEGMDLQQKIRQERLSYDTKMQIMIDVCEGLVFAHGHDIIHRDIKPANIFVTTNGRVKILDFGLARGALSEVTQTGKILGSPNYMAPEQIRGEDVDHRADIFATGVVFYELLTGRKAFEGDSIATTIYKVLETQPDAGAPARRKCAGRRSRASSNGRWPRTGAPGFRRAARCSMPSCTRTAAAHTSSGRTCKRCRRLSSVPAQTSASLRRPRRVAAARRPSRAGSSPLSRSRASPASPS